MTTGENSGSGAQILDPAVGAGADENPIDRNVRQCHARFQIHIGKSVAQRFCFGRIGFRSRIGNVRCDCGGMFRARAPGGCRCDVFCIEHDLAIEDRFVVAGKLTPVGDGCIKSIPLRRIGAAAQPREGGLIRRDQTQARAGFNRHVAQGQPAFDRQAAHGATGIFDGTTLRIAGTDARDDRQRHVLRRKTRCQRAVDPQPHAFRARLPDRLGHQHMRHFRRADAKGVSAKRPVGGGVAVAANDQQAGQGDAELRRHHMSDALPGMALAEAGDAVLRCILLQLPDHPPRIVRLHGAGARRHVMVGHAKCQVRPGHLRAARFRIGETVMGTLVDEVAIDPEQAVAVVALDDGVGIPDFVDNGAGRAALHGGSLSTTWRTRKRASR